MSEVRRHLFPIEVAKQDVDFMGHVNNARYLGWVQDAVISHWRCVAPFELVDAYLWVALRHEIDYRRPSFDGEALIADVNLTGLKGARATYQTIIRRGGEIIAEITSVWCCLDARTLKPARIAAAVLDKLRGA